MHQVEPIAFFAILDCITIVTAYSVAAKETKSIELSTHMTDKHYLQPEDTFIQSDALVSKMKLQL